MSWYVNEQANGQCKSNICSGYVALRSTVHLVNA